MERGADWRRYPVMSDRYQIFVSTENSRYMAWQTQLFCYSAWTALDQRPVVVLHDSGETIRAEYLDLQKRGFTVIEVPSYATTRARGAYPPRNEVGSLVEIASKPPLGSGPILFCEPDMLFVQPLGYGSGLAAEFYVYLHYEDPHVRNVLRKFGMGHLADEFNKTRRFGVPYLIPQQHLQGLARRWIEVIDQFDQLEWIDIMYAFGIALALEGLDVEITHFMTDNYRPTRPLRHVIHYCYGDNAWNKRSFRCSSPLELPNESLAFGQPGTVLGEIMRQLRGAKAFFSVSAGQPGADRVAFDRSRRGNPAWY
jgi:hypothetical protein